MCGILISNTDTNTTLFKKALDLQSYRGPDGNKTVQLDNIFLGFNYLSITGKQKNYWQPYTLKNLILLFNGEIYNYKKLNKNIQKIDKNFKSDSDTKTLINYFLHFGVNKTLKDIRGMWSLCLLDTKKKSLYVSRDRLGIKPLFYYKHKNKFIFSSSIKSINSLLREKKFNKKYLKKYLIKGELDNSKETPFKNIFNFPTASILKLKIQDRSSYNFKFTKFWNLRKGETYDDSKISNFKKLLNDNLALHNHSSKMIKTLIPLSSGLDSTYIQRRLFGKNNLSMSLSGHFFNEEVPMIKKFVKDKSLNHEFLNIKKNDYSVKKLDKFIELLDQPIRSLNPYFQYLIRKKAKKLKIRVLQNGDGGDEVFGGYLYALPYMLNFFNKKSNLKLHNLKKSFIKDFATPLSKINFFKNNKKKIDLKCFLISRILKTHIPYWLRVDDEISMLNSIENRVPYLDHKIIEFCMKIKTQFFYKNGLNKFFFRKSIKGELPNYIMNQKKIGKPGSSYIITYTVLKKPILKIIHKNFLKNYIGLNKNKLKKMFLNDINCNNKNNSDFWFRVFFLCKWLEKKSVK